MTAVKLLNKVKELYEAQSCSATLRVGQLCTSRDRPHFIM